MYGPNFRAAITEAGLPIAIFKSEELVETGPMTDEQRAQLDDIVANHDPNDPEAPLPPHARVVT